ncbi:NAD+ synthase [Aurantimicrobium photophilum]|uniref:Glutamine-dependent NAD(+) synthetase n=1 Tax=Aurantimicrobium photophilum TaxID=1987356 RepID=A0A2Z3RWZ4_9MICO|nr:NAD+ synthase [Aurantimicrobium photophilum]AWR21345.1 Glutamine-dependent NAD(+) synthetase [Aurantimicrobium photophilum]
MPILRLALAQTNPRLGDFSRNVLQIVNTAVEAFGKGADLVAFGEMSLTGYPIEDLATRPDFLRETRTHLEDIATQIAASGAGSIPVIVGFPHGPLDDHHANSGSPSAIAYNSAAVLQDGRIIGIYNKHHLPNYSVFDEYRIFRAGSDALVLHVAGADVALAICEDIWREGGPVAAIAEVKPSLLLILNGSPFEREKDEVRLPLVQRRAEQVNAPAVYLNLVGGQDDLVFDGGSFVTNASGKVLARAHQFVEQTLLVDIDVKDSTTNGSQVGPGVVVVEAGAGNPQRSTRAKVTAEIAPQLDINEQIWDALVLGMRDYVEKNGFRSVILGLSGGIDSAVCAALAVDAIGPDRVFGVSMPSNYSSDHSRSDADDLAERLGIDIRTEAIAPLVDPVETQLHLDGVAAENLQARIRGIILMGLSNAEGHLVLTTGNKTEIAVGYSTIYGDSVGGFAPIRDVPKTLVWELAKWRNEHARTKGLTPPIPENSITKPPSAELRPGQVDQDTLPEYDVLDAILDAYITERVGRDVIISRGFGAEMVDRVISLVDRAEWKRRQGAIGPKISEMAFGRDRRLPVTFTRN